MRSRCHERVDLARQVDESCAQSPNEERVVAHREVLVPDEADARPAKGFEKLDDPPRGVAIVLDATDPSDEARPERLRPCLEDDRLLTPRADEEEPTEALDIPVGEVAEVPLAAHLRRADDYDRGAVRRCGYPAEGLVAAVAF